MNLKIRVGWWVFLRATRWVGQGGIDQWELLKFPDKYGATYVMLSRAPFPDTDESHYRAV